MKLVVGLGNPGWQYADTRHNAGWWAINELSKGYGFERHLGGIYRKEGGVLYVMSDTVFMNQHGILVKAFCEWYHVQPTDVVIVHDDMDFEPGIVRVKSGGGNGGHNGLKSITTAIGPDYTRVRIGVGRPEEDILEYVLSAPSEEERSKLNVAIAKGAEAVRMILEFGVDHAMSQVNT